MALGPRGSPRCRCREKAQVPVKPSSWLLALPLTILSLSSPPVCVAHRPGGPLCQAPAFPYQLCLLVLFLWVSPLVGHHESHAPGVSEDRLSPVFSWDNQILQL